MTAIKSCLCYNHSSTYSQREHGYCLTGCCYQAQVLWRMLLLGSLVSGLPTTIGSCIRILIIGHNFPHFCLISVLLGSSQMAHCPKSWITVPPPVTLQEKFGIELMKSNDFYFHGCKAAASAVSILERNEEKTKKKDWPENIFPPLIISFLTVQFK